MVEYRKSLGIVSVKSSIFAIVKENITDCKIINLFLEGKPNVSTAPQVSQFVKRALSFAIRDVTSSQHLHQL